MHPPATTPPTPISPAHPAHFVPALRNLGQEARLLRRIRELPHKERTEALTKEGGVTDQRELLEEIDQEVNRGRELLAGMPTPQDP